MEKILSILNQSTLKKLRLFLSGFLILIFFSSSVWGEDLVILPNANWSIENIDESTQELYNKKLGKVFTVRVAKAELGQVSVNDFLGLVYRELSHHEDYAGARFTKISSQKIKKDRWLYFSLKRQDNVYQEIWAKPTQGQNAIVFLYTASEDYYKKYRKDYLKIIDKI